ncbi:MAG: 5-(carboxyamino)imidazole ribonucleotide mutase [Firmicutes bacterium]|nr:5-(carboxyamino)imidazole ribonucleotide mutase [Bacillota bacterium]
MSKQNIQIGVIYGSDSDLPKMLPAFEIFKLFEKEYGIRVAVETKIVSAHRTPDEVVKYAKSAYSRGLRVIIAAAGGSAHLPGMIAADTALPVIGVPISSKPELAALLSIVQMPPGIPVNTMGIDASANAALAALQILALTDSKLYEALLKYKQSLADTVAKKNAELERLGAEAYVKKNLK